MAVENTSDNASHRGSNNTSDNVIDNASQTDLNRGQCQPIPLVGGRLLFWPDFLSGAEADWLFASLRQRVPWQSSTIRIAGREIPVPRLNAMYGDTMADYQYSGIHLPLHDWLEELAKLKVSVCAASDRQFNTALLNLYRDGRDSVDWHSDDEHSLGKHAVVAAVSLGAARRFDLRPCRSNTEAFSRGRRKTICLELPGGSLLVMAGNTQTNWQHRIAKASGNFGERISITFRNVVYPSSVAHASE
jgi:alkylated DNA repair dioxygenase AlkB